MEFLTVASLHLFAVASPGPDFALVIRQCFRYGKKSAIWTSLGISVGILFHVSLSLIGLGLFKLTLIIPPRAFCPNIKD